MAIAEIADVGATWLRDSLKTQLAEARNCEAAALDRLAKLMHAHATFDALAMADALNLADARARVYFLERKLESMGW